MTEPMIDSAPPPLPRKSSASWNFVGWSVAAVHCVSSMSVVVTVVRSRGAATSITILGASLMIAAVGFSLWAFLRCSQRPTLPKLVCLALFLLGLCITARMAMDWAGF